MTGGVHVHGELPQLSLGYQTFFEKCTHFFVMKSNTKVKQRTNPGIFEEKILFIISYVLNSTKMKTIKQ